MEFNRFFTNDEIDTLIKDWCAKYPGLVKEEIIGTSHNKIPIRLLIITNWQSGKDTDKPALWIDANIHATELTGSNCALYCIDQLLTGYGSEKQITQILDRAVFYIVPRVNPDGAELAMSSNPRYIRSGVRKYPWEEMEEGLHIQDINQDGKILQMRLKDPNGDWKISTLDPRLMEKRNPDEYEGDYYRLLPEGILEEYDGYLIKEARAPEGLDFNRNFPFQWRTEGEQSGAGPYPASEPEIRALVDFITRHPNINIALTFHTFSRVILRPYSTKSDDEMIVEDLWVYKKMGEIGTRASGYRCVSTFHDFKYHPKEVTTGAFDDWVYDHLGIYSFTIELWDLPSEAGIKDRKFMEWWKDHPHTEDVQIMNWINEHGEPDSYSDWTEFEHPQLGKIEIGGWNTINTWRNPPSSHIESEISRHFPFIISLANMLPWLTVHTVNIDSIGKDDYRLTLVVENNGFLPSFTSEQAKYRKAIRPIRVELVLPEGAELLLNHKRSNQVGHLEGRSNKLSLTSTYSSSPTDNRGKVEWAIHAPQNKELTINILSERAGSKQLNILLDKDAKRKV